MLEQSYTRHFVLFFHNFWRTNVLPAPILVIIISYWNIQSYLWQVGQMSLKLAADWPETCSYSGRASSGVCFMHASFTETHL